MLLCEVAELQSFFIFVSTTLDLKSVLGIGRHPVGLAYTIFSLYCQLVLNGDSTNLGAV